MLSKGNPADALSREGLSDMFVAARVAPGEWLVAEALSPAPLPSLSFEEHRTRFLPEKDAVGVDAF